MAVERLRSPFHDVCVTVDSSAGSSGSTSGSGKPTPADDTAGGAVSSAPVSTAGTGARDSVMGADTGGYGGDDGGTGTGGAGPSTSIVPSTQQL
jgi:hypothetical protein